MIADKPGERRRLMRLGRAAAATGLPPPTNEPVWLGAGITMLEALKRDKPGGAAEAARFALSLLEATMARPATREKVECARGCAWCCHSVVSVTAPEAFLLAQYIRANAPGRALERQPETIVVVAKSRSSTVESLLQAKPPCPLLGDGVCSVYDARPSNCRRLLSTSKAICKASFEGAAIAIPAVAEAMQKGAHVRALLLAAVAAQGRSTDGYELAQALVIALEEPDAEARWLTGEDVFAPVPIKQALGPMQAAVDRWCGQLLRFY